jgi:lipopolysaccharide heptosyltransferase II
VTKLIFNIARQFVPSRKPAASAAIHRILIIKLCCIGDIMFTTPLLRALAVKYPHAKITYMVGSWSRDLAAAAPGVSNTIIFDAYDPISWMEKLQRFWNAVRNIRQGRFDMAIVLHRTPLAGLLVAAAGVPVRIGFDWQGNGFAHTVPVPYRAEAHEVDRNLDCLKAIGVASKGNWLEFMPPVAAQESADAFLERYCVNRDEGPLVALFPGGGVNPGTVMTTKRWAVKGYRDLCRRLVLDFNARIILVGNSQDKEIGDELLQGELVDLPVIRAEGKTSLLVLAALLKRCCLFIGGDSGPLHLAAAVGTPTVSIFGPTSPELLAPRGTNHRVVSKRLSCSPCYTPVTMRQGDVPVCRFGTVRCIHEITTDEVLKAARELMNPSQERDNS